MTAAQLSIAFFLQMAIIVGISRVVGSIAHRYFGQPQVVGEMIAGVILGPTLFKLEAALARAAEQLPTHEAFIPQNCAASA